MNEHCLLSNKLAMFIPTLLGGSPSPLAQQAGNDSATLGRTDKGKEEAEFVQQVQSSPLKEDSSPHETTSRTQIEAVIIENDSVTQGVLTAILTSLGDWVLIRSTEAEVRRALADSQGLVVFLDLDEACETRLAFCQWLRR